MARIDLWFPSDRHPPQFLNLWAFILHLLHMLWKAPVCPVLPISFKVAHCAPSYVQFIGRLKCHNEVDLLMCAKRKPAFIAAQQHKSEVKYIPPAMRFAQIFNLERFWSRSVYLTCARIFIPIEGRPLAAAFLTRNRLYWLFLFPSTASLPLSLYPPGAGRGRGSLILFTRQEYRGRAGKGPHRSHKKVCHTQPLIRIY